MPTQLLRVHEARARLNGRSRSGFYNDIENGLVPPPIKTGERSVGWPELEIDAIVRARIAGADNDQIRQLVGKLVDDRKKLMPSVDASRTTPHTPSTSLEQEVRDLITQLKAALKALSE